jgi:hypothetical protein
MVEKSGNKAIIDPLSKQDVLWSFIDFYTSNQVANFKSFTPDENNFIAEKDIAAYFGAHLSDNQTFERILKVMLHFDSDPVQNTAFHNAVF